MKALSPRVIVIGAGRPVKHTPLSSMPNRMETPTPPRSNTERGAVMLAKNDTPFAAISFEHMHRDDMPMAVVAVRASYNLSADGQLTLSNRQELVYADEYLGNPVSTALCRVSDLVPFKPHTDITIIGYTYPPEGASAIGWDFGLTLGKNSRMLRAHGLREWIRQDDDSWQLGKTSAVDRVPLDYRYSAGSTILDSTDNDPNGDNPVGIARLDPERTYRQDRIPAVLIENPDEKTPDPFHMAAPQGTGPIAPTWGFRMRYTGTTDKNWYETRFPNVPDDFDYRFFQCAHPSLIWHGFLKGDETFILHRLVAGGNCVQFQLPGICPYARFEWLDGRVAMAKLNLDGIHIDTGNKEAPWKVDLTWRGWAAICPQFFKVDLFHAELDDPILEGLLVSDENGLSEGVSA